MATEKTRASAYLSENSETMLDAIISMLHLSPSRGRSTAIEEAIKFYYGYLSGQLSMDYLCGVYGKQIEAIVNSSASRLTSMLFKQAVETNMLTRIVAEDYGLSKEDYDKMRSKAVEAVKRSHGRISLIDTVNESH